MVVEIKNNVEGEDLEDTLLVRDEILEEQFEYEKPVIAARRSRWNTKLSALTPGLWVLLSVWSTLAARRILTKDFPYPICFLVLLQVVAYCCIAWFVLLIVVGDLLLDRDRKCQGSDVQLSLKQMFFILGRYCLTVCLSMAALICSAEALMRFSNFSVLVMLPILIYALDSLLFSFVYSLRLRLLPRDHALDHRIVVWAVVVCGFVSMILVEDYRLKPSGLQFAIAGIFLTSLARLIAGIGPQIPKIGLHTWDCSFFWFLWAGMPPCLFITIYAACKYEDVGLAFQIVWSWDMSTIFANLAPGVLTHLLCNTSLRATLPLSTTEGAAYQIGGESVVDAIEATIQASLLLIPISALREDNLIDWIQVCAFVFIFVISVGPKQISLYPPRLINFLRRRSRDSKWYASWHKPAVLCTITVLFAFLTSAILFYWTNTISFGHSQEFWLGSGAAILDSTYRAPSQDRLEIVIAHSAGDPVDGVSEIITLMTGMSTILFFNPRITIYTKDASENITHEILDATGIDDSNIKSLKNTGGVTATYLHHILTNWDTLPTHTIFFSATPNTLHNLGLITTRLTEYYTGPAGYPYPETMFPASGFLNLGDYTTCDCNNCYELGSNSNSSWSDTFRLLPSMWGASHPSTPTCHNVLLTHGNNFIASAARIRGLKKDAWETLFTALINEDLGNAWAHDKTKIGWKEGGKEMRIEGEGDSLEKPFLGYTVERLWAVLLQCSKREVAWRCPSMAAGWRSGGEKGDCGCID